MVFFFGLNSDAPLVLPSSPTSDSINVRYCHYVIITRAKQHVSDRECRVSLSGIQGGGPRHEPGDAVMNTTATRLKNDSSQPSGGKKKLKKNVSIDARGGKHRTPASQRRLSPTRILYTLFTHTLYTLTHTNTACTQRAHAVLTTSEGTTS